MNVNNRAIIITICSPKAEFKRRETNQPIGKGVSLENENDSYSQASFNWLSLISTQISQKSNRKYKLEFPPINRGEGGREGEGDRPSLPPQSIKGHQGKSGRGFFRK